MRRSEHRRRLNHPRKCSRTPNPLCPDGIQHHQSILADALERELPHITIDSPIPGRSTPINRESQPSDPGIGSQPAGSSRSPDAPRIRRSPARPARPGRQWYSDRHVPVVATDRGPDRHDEALHGPAAQQLDSAVRKARLWDDRNQIPRGARTTAMATPRWRASRVVLALKKVIAWLRCRFGWLLSVSRGA